jgi:hypothetical protein
MLQSESNMKEKRENSVECMGIQIARSLLQEDEDKVSQLDSSSVITIVVSPNTMAQSVTFLVHSSGIRL